MGSQWREGKMGEMCSYLHVPVKRRAAAFWTIWRRTNLHTECVTVVQPSSNKGVDYGLKKLPLKDWLYFCQLPQLEKARFNYWPDLVFELKIRVHFKPRLVTVGLTTGARDLQGGFQWSQKNHHFCLFTIKVEKVQSHPGLYVVKTRVKSLCQSGT